MPISYLMVVKSSSNEIRERTNRAIVQTFRNGNFEGTKRPYVTNNERLLRERTKRAIVQILENGNYEGGETTICNEQLDRHQGERIW